MAMFSFSNSNANKDTDETNYDKKHNHHGNYNDKQHSYIKNVECYEQ